MDEHQLREIERERDNAEARATANRAEAAGARADRDVAIARAERAERLREVARRNEVAAQAELHQMKKETFPLLGRYVQRAEEAEAALARLQQDFSTLCVLARRDHSVCDDLYYSCPSSGANPHGNDGTCDCGAAEHNAKVDAIVNGLMPIFQPAPLDAPDAPVNPDCTIRGTA